MIAINLVVPYADRPFIDRKEADDFRIISSAKDRSKTRRVYVVETTEEEATFLTIKYGSENVWKR